MPAQCNENKISYNVRMRSAVVLLVASLGAVTPAQELFSMLDATMSGDGLYKNKQEAPAAGSAWVTLTANKNGSSFEADGESGPNWSKLRVFCDVSRPSSSSPSSSGAQIKKRLRDRLNVRAKNNRTQTLKLYLIVEALGDVASTAVPGANSNSIWEMVIQGSAGATGAQTVGGGLYNSGGISNYYGHAPGQFIMGPLLCTEGSPFLMTLDHYVRAECVSSSVTGPIGEAETDFSHTFRILGVSVKDEGNNPITNFTVLSELGLDYTKAANPAKLKSLDLSDYDVVGGETVVGTVTLNRRAEQGGQTVILRSKGASAQTPESHIVPYLSLSGNFPITTSPVGTTHNVDIVARMGPVTRVKTLTINPASPTGLQQS